MHFKEDFCIIIGIFNWIFEVIMKRLQNSNFIYYVGIVFVVLVWSLFPIVTKNLFVLYTPSLWDSAGSLISVISLLIISRKKLHLLNWQYFKVAVPTLVSSHAPSSSHPPNCCESNDAKR